MRSYILRLGPYDAMVKLSEFDVLYRCDDTKGRVLLPEILTKECSWKLARGKKKITLIYSYHIEKTLKWIGRNIGHLFGTFYVLICWFVCFDLLVSEQLVKLKLLRNEWNDTISPFDTIRTQMRRRSTSDNALRRQIELATRPRCDILGECLISIG